MVLVGQPPETVGGERCAKRPDMSRILKTRTVSLSVHTELMTLPPLLFRPLHSIRFCENCACTNVHYEQVVMQCDYGGDSFVTVLNLRQEEPPTRVLAPPLLLFFAVLAQGMAQCFYSKKKCSTHRSQLIERGQRTRMLAKVTADGDFELLAFFQTRTCGIMLTI